MDFGIRFLSSYLVSGLDEAQAGIKRAGRNINNLRYADDSTLMRESEEELKSLLMTVPGLVGCMGQLLSAAPALSQPGTLGCHP